ncbi:1,4-dihydroxy-2-naphthoate octaprenyltransferase [Aureitalea marina]|uniref:1,4-dihydroxy-2-naphthoate octaprenyltransferase n=1 Tax=Aureitalea marina TaxID=930804 RepID=A0A2S7KN71_9FLAO|nr:1,4-dihydroxy-2-naphthoate octaprenyltransferase [Aureitalea marina]PQB04077.1 1,4-dihydroxy-2-naphthoate octaprenyltransferase [Aureitalea marina]
MSKTKAWIEAARLRTLPLSLSGIIAAAAVAITEDVFSGVIFTLSLLTTLSFQILSNFANDYGDGVKGTDNDERLGPKRALQSGILTAHELKQGMLFNSVVSMLLSAILILIAFWERDWMYMAIYAGLGVFAVTAAITYTVGKGAYGYIGLGDLFVFLFFGIIGVVAAYFLYTDQLNYEIVWLSLSVGCLSTAVLNLNNMRDRDNDANVGKITLAVRLGEKGALLYHSLLVVTAIVFALRFMLSKDNTIWLIPALALIPLIIHLIRVVRIKEPAGFDPELKKVALSTFALSILIFICSLIV